MTAIWKPTQAECNLIRAAAAREADKKESSVLLEPGWRCNVKDASRPSSMNIALVSDEGHWNDTDLADYGEWSEFRKGVPLTEDGRAIVDFYIRTRNDEWAELHGNVSVNYAGGKITRIYGYGRPGDYPIA